MTDLLTDCDNGAQVLQPTIKPKRRDGFRQHIPRGLLMQKVKECDIQFGEVNIRGDVGRASRRAHRCKHCLPTGERAQVPEPWLSTSQIACQVEVRKVRVGVIVRRTY
jgi:hypothetical protein